MSATHEAGILSMFYLDELIKTADKFEIDRKKYVMTSVMALVMTVDTINFKLYEPDKVDEPENKIPESTLKLMANDVVEYAERVAKSYCHNHFARCNQEEVQDVTKQLLQFLGKKINETNNEERRKTCSE